MANTVNIGDYQYTLYDSTGKAEAIVRDKTKSSYGNIPSTITVSGKTYNVTSLTACFSGCRALTTAPTIPSSVVMMDECFYGCSSLVNPPVLPENASSLNECFYGCSSLVNPPVLPTYAQNLRGCFSGCSSLTSAPTIPFFAQVMNECFSGCSSLVDAPAIPDRVYSMTSCFSGCSSLTTAPTIPSSVTKLSYCFQNCSSLTTAPTIPSSVTILSYCFQNCSALTTAPTIPSGVTDLYGCFSGCSSLTTAPTISSSVTDMRYCFEDCSSLTTAPTIPSSVTDLSRCFSGCSSLTTAPTIPSSIIDLSGCFYNCSSLTTVPTIPSSVKTLRYCFYGCSALTTAPVIPSSVLEIQGCFQNCSSLTTAPVIPSSVLEIQGCFQNCGALTGNVTINTNAVAFSLLFNNTQKGIWLTGTSSKLSDYAATANNNNVFVGEIPLSYSMTIERVNGDGGTTQDPEGLYAHIQLTINWADFTENSLDAITLKNEMASTNPTWYIDAAKTNTITLPNWQPSASTTIHCWLAITGATNVFSVTVADRYHTGVVITFTVPQQFRTMDFLAGGQGVAFGMPATQNGMFINMDLAIKEYSGNIKNIYDVFYPVGSYYETDLPSAIPSGQSTPTSTDLENLGTTWFDPNFAWGGTWVLESEGMVHISGTANGTYKAGTKYGANTKKIEDANIAHGHGFTMPTMASSGSGTSGDGGSHSGTFDLRFWGTGRGVTGVSGVFTQKDQTTAANAFTASSSNPNKVQRVTLSVGNHKHSTPNHTHTWSKNGSVNNLGTPSSRSNFNVMQESLAVYRWHRTA